MSKKQKRKLEKARLLAEQGIDPVQELEGERDPLKYLEEGQKKSIDEKLISIRINKMC